MNKKGLEMSIGFVVFFIMAILIFGLSIYLLFKWFGQAQELQARIDSKTQEQIISALRQGNELVAIPFSVAEVSRGGWASFGIGIRNIASTSTFRVDSHFSGGAYTPSGQPIPVDENYINDQWLGAFSTGNPVRIERAGEEVIPLSIKADANIAPGQTTPKGDYIFDVCVFKDLDKTTPPPCTLQGYRSNPDAFYTNKMYQVTIRVI